MWMCTVNLSNSSLAEKIEECHEPIYAPSNRLPLNRHPEEHMFIVPLVPSVSFWKFYCNEDKSLQLSIFKKESLWKSL